MIQGYRRYRLMSATEERLVLPDFPPLVQRAGGPPTPLNIQPERVHVRTYRLRGAAAYTWDSRELEAECKGDRLKGPGRYDGLDPNTRLAAHLASGTHKCGIHITKTTMPGAGVTFEDYPVVAWVTGWGNFVEYDVGWRVQFARIEWLKVFDGSRDADKIRDELARVYGVPVEVTGGTQPCCQRDHTSNLYKTSERAEVPICKMPSDELYKLFEVTKLMGFNTFSQRALSEIMKELAARQEVHYDVLTRQWMSMTGDVIFSEIDAMR